MDGATPSDQTRLSRIVDSMRSAAGGKSLGIHVREHGRRSCESGASLLLVPELRDVGCLANETER
jgi:hypothetical protein